jgi:hypothetical protein
VAAVGVIASVLRRPLTAGLAIIIYWRFTLAFLRQLVSFPAAMSFVAASSSGARSCSAFSSLLTCFLRRTIDSAGLGDRLAQHTVRLWLGGRSEDFSQFFHAGKTFPVVSRRTAIVFDELLGHVTAPSGEFNAP